MEIDLTNFELFKSFSEFEKEGIHIDLQTNLIAALLNIHGNESSLYFLLSRMHIVLWMLKMLTLYLRIVAYKTILLNLMGPMVIWVQLM